MSYDRLGCLIVTTWRGGIGMLDSDAQSTLTDLRWHWDDAYKIDCRDGVWLAVPLTDPFVTISRDSSAELREALRQDYAQRAGQRWAGNSST